MRDFLIYTPTMAKALNLEESVYYEEIPSKSVAASRVLADAYKKLGRPEDPFSKAGEQMMRFIVATWEDLYPKQVIQWVNTKKEYQSAEMTMHQQIKKQTGRSLASLPTPIYRMMKKIFPKYKLNDRDQWLKFLKKFPMFKMTTEKKGDFFFMGDSKK